MTTTAYDEFEACEVTCSVCEVTYTGYGHRCDVRPDEEQVVIENGEAVYDVHGRVRTSYRGRLGWAYLTHLELDEDA